MYKCSPFGFMSNTEFLWNFCDKATNIFHVYDYHKLVDQLRSVMEILQLELRISHSSFACDLGSNFCFTALNCPVSSERLWLCWRSPLPLLVPVSFPKKRKLSPVSLGTFTKHIKPGFRHLLSSAISGWTKVAWGTEVNPPLLYLCPQSDVVTDPKHLTCKKVSWHFCICVTARSHD